MIVLPPRYYLDHFEYLLRFVEQQYAHILGEEEQTFVRDFRALSTDARCLYLRMSNRKGPLFRVARFAYEEIEALPSALDELYAAGFALPVRPAEAFPPALLLPIYTKNELLELLGTSPHAALLRHARTLPKEPLVRWMAALPDMATHWHAQAEAECLSSLGRQEAADALRFLFFGNQWQGMSEFVIRDVGHLRFEEAGQLLPRYTDRAQWVAEWTALRGRHAWTHRLEQDPDEARSFVLEWVGQQPPAVLAQAGEWLLEAGLWLERQRHYEDALRMFSLTVLPPSRERQVRILQKIGQTEDAQALARQIAEQPQNAAEYFFAHDFLHPGEKRKAKNSTTIFLKEAEELAVPVGWRYRVEAGVLATLALSGWQGWHIENHLWRSLFGLVFWEEIFAHSLHQPLQRSPSDFYQPAFWEKRQHLLHQKLERLHSAERLFEHIRLVHDTKVGTANPAVFWHEGLLTLAELACRLMPVAGLHAVLLEMARNLREGLRGFPDLLVWQADGRFELIEVKSPTDHLAPQQLYWIAFLNRCGLPAKVLRVRWVEGPQAGQTDPSADAAETLPPA